MITWSKNATIGDLYAPAMKIKTKAEARQYLKSLVNWAVTKWRQKPEKAKAIQLSNLGYFAGYYDTATMRRVNELFNTSHPIFGRSTPTPMAAFKAGVRRGKAARRK